MRIRLSENFRAAFYAPFYATMELGFFKSEGLDIQLIDSATPGSGTEGLINGSLDVTWGGPMRAMKAHDEGGPALVCFAEVVRRDPFYLIGRKGAADFGLPDLARLHIATVSEVPTPWLCLQHDLREIGIDPTALSRIADCSMQANLEALGRGEIDVAQMFEPFASMAVRQGHPILHAAAGRGPTSYTTFLTTRPNAERHRAAFAAMTRAVGNMQGWLWSHSGAELASVVQRYFPHIDQADLAAAYERYKAAELWARDTPVSRTGFDRLAQSLKSGGFIRAAPAYEACVVDPLAA